MSKLKHFVKYLGRRFQGAYHGRNNVTRVNAYMCGDALDRRRVIDPPKCFIPKGEFKSNTMVVGNKDAPVGIMTSDHGLYIKPEKQLANAQFEWTFGFGAGGIGYTPARVVFYPY